MAGGCRGVLETGAWGQATQYSNLIGRSTLPAFGSAEPDEYKDKLKEVEDVCNPIIAEVYKKSGGPSDGGDSEDLGDHDEL